METTDLGFRKEVALKLLRATDGDKVQALQQEARLVAALRHPNIVDVLAVEEIDGTWTVVMEYVDGGTLEALINRLVDAGLRLPASVVLDLGLDITRALDRAHNAVDVDGKPNCVLHRDLKPANVLIDSAGVAKLTDFGVAKVVGEAAATATGTAKGTPAYIAPESWAGNRDFAPTVDLFGLGCIVYELVTLERLFDGEAITNIFWQMVNRKPAEEVAPVRKELPGLATVLEKLLEREPEQRYQTAAEVEDDLVALRGQVGPSGHMSQFLKLLDAAEQSGDGKPRRATPRVPQTGDVAWRELVARATGEVAPPVPVSGNVQELANTDLLSRPRASSDAVATDLVGTEPRPKKRQRSSPGTSAGTARRDGTARRKTGRRKPGGGSGGTERRSRAPESTGTERRRRQEGGKAPRRDEPDETRSGFRVPPAILVSVLVATGAVAIALVLVVLLRSSPSEPTPTPAPTAAPLADLDIDQLPDLPPSETPRTTPSTRRTPRPTPRTGEPTPARATPTPEPAATVDAATPAPEQQTPTPEPVTPEATPAEATPAPAATPRDTGGPPPDKACLVMTSQPARAGVWIDGAAQSRKALASGSRLGARMSPGWVTVGMGSGERPTAWLDVELVLGRSATVHCDLGTNSCTASTGGFGPCDR